MPIFAKQGEYEPCGIFTKEHFLLILLTIIGIKISLKKTINKTHKEIKQIIKKCTIAMWIFEVIIILFKIITGGIKNLNNYVPLYYCSLLLYAGLLSSFAKNWRCIFSYRRNYRWNSIYFISIYIITNISSNSHSKFT